MSDRDSPTPPPLIPDFPNFADAEIAADKADGERERQQRHTAQATDLTRIIRDGAADGAGGGTDDGDDETHLSNDPVEPTGTTGHAAAPGCFKRSSSRPRSH
jgi:hypothetical protein